MRTLSPPRPIIARVSLSKATSPLRNRKKENHTQDNLNPLESISIPLEFSSISISDDFDHFDDFSRRANNVSLSCASFQSLEQLQVRSLLFFFSFFSLLLVLF